MNRQRRKALRNLIGRAEALAEELRQLIEEEEEARDAVPESLQQTDRYTNMETAVDTMTEAADSLDELAEQLGEIAE